MALGCNTTVDASVSIGILFDISDSMAPKLGKGREAVNAILDKANADDEFFLIPFGVEDPAR